MLLSCDGGWDGSCRLTAGRSHGQGEYRTYTCWEWKKIVDKGEERQMGCIEERQVCTVQSNICLTLSYANISIGFNLFGDI